MESVVDADMYGHQNRRGYGYHTAMDKDMDKDMDIGMNMDMDRGPLEVKLSIPNLSDKIYARKQNHELFWLKAQF